MVQPPDFGVWVHQTRVAFVVVFAGALLFAGPLLFALYEFVMGGPQIGYVPSIFLAGVGVVLLSIGNYRVAKIRNSIRRARALSSSIGQPRPRQ